MTGFLVAASLVLSLGAALPCIIGTLRGNSRPVPVSWLTWAAVLAVGSAAATKASQVPSGMFTAAAAVECVAVAVLALRIPAASRDRPVLVPLPRGRRVRLDGICAAGGALGLVLLVVIRAPGPAVAVSIGTDAIGYVPTGIHAFRKPHEEPWSAYAMFALGALLALAATGGYVFAGFGYLLYLLAADGGLTALIVVRRVTARGKGRHAKGSFPALRPAGVTLPRLSPPRFYRDA
jgi:hypothetical protein